MFRLIALLFIALSLATAASEAQSPAARSLCELTTDSQASDGNSFMIQALYAHTFHGALITDDACPSARANVIYAQSGSGLTQAQLNSAASTIQGSIDKAWSGSFSQDGVSYNVSTNVSVLVFGSQYAASGSGVQNVIGISNGDAIPGQADSYVNPRSLGGAIFGGQDTGVWNYNNLGTGVAAHEFTHLLGVDDRTSGAILSNTNYLNDPSIPHTATASDLRWGVQEATQGVNAHYSGGINTPVFSVSPSPNYSGQTTVGAAWHWWK